MYTFQDWRLWRCPVFFHKHNWITGGLRVSKNHHGPHCSYIYVFRETCLYTYIYMHMHICMYVYIFIHAYIIVYIYMITQIGVICGYISHTCLCLFPQIQCIDPHKQPWGCFSIIWNIHLVFLCMGSNGVVGSNLLDCGSINDVVAILFWRKGFYAYSRLECPQRLSKWSEAPFWSAHIAQISPEK